MNYFAQVLLGVLVRHNRLNSEKRLKLACTPLKSLQANSVEIASIKFQTWWYVLCNVVDNSAVYNSMVFEPFLKFCFGPLAVDPNIRSEIVDEMAHVKRFPDVSLMAIATFVRILGEPSALTEEIFKKYGLDQIDRTICTERQFHNELARLIINACGEATFMLTNLGDDSNNDVDCCSLASLMWQNLLTHLNRAKYHEHMNLMLANVKQLLVTSAQAQNDDRREKTISLVRIIVVMLTETARSFEKSDERTANDAASHQIVVDLLNIVTMLPAAHSSDLLASALVIPPTAMVQYVQAHSHILHANFLAIGVHHEQDALNVSTEQVVRTKFRIWQKWLGAVQSWWRENSAAVQKLKDKSLSAFIDPIVECLLWPLTVLIDSKEVCAKFVIDSHIENDYKFPLSYSQALTYAKSLNELAQLISAAVGRKLFCQRSAKSIRSAIARPQHCAHITNVVAVLFDFMNYDYKGKVQNHINFRLKLILVIVRRYPRRSGRCVGLVRFVNQFGEENFVSRFESDCAGHRRLLQSDIESPACSYRNEITRSDGIH